MSAGFALPSLARRPIMVAGNNCIEVQLITSNNIILSVADLFDLSLHIDSIALIPIGVAAPPMPSRFADILTVMYSNVWSDSPLNNRLVMGRHSLLRNLLMPAFSISFNRLNHTQYIANIVRVSVMAAVAPSIIAGNILPGAVNIR